MSYIDAECPECSEQFEVYSDDDCDECSILEQQVADLEMAQQSEEQEKKLEEYERLKAWLLNFYKINPSDLILGLDHAVAYIISDFLAFQGQDCNYMEESEFEAARKEIKKSMSFL